MPGEQQTIGTYYFKLKLGGHDASGFFKECAGLPSEDQVVTDTSSDHKGQSLAEKSPAQRQWSNINLKRGVDSNSELWKWRQEVIDGKIGAARKDGTIEVVDREGKPVSIYRFVRGWPCKYIAPGLNSGGNEILVEEIEIAHEGFSRTL